MTLEELYAALEEADRRAQAGDEEARQDAIELASMIEQFKESSAPAQEPDAVSPIIVGTATGIAAGAKGATEMLPTAENIARANRLINPPAAAPAAPAAPAATTPHGFHPGATSNAQFNAEQIEANKLLKPGNVPPGYKVEGNSRIIVPTTVDTPVKGTSPIIASKQEARKIALDKLKRGTTATGQFTGKVPGINVVTGGMAGYQGADAYNRAQRGDVPGAVVSGIGSAGSATSTLLGKKHPIARIGGLGVGLLAPVVNRAIDAQSTKEEKAMGGPVGYAAGGLSTISQMLKRAPKKSKEQIYEIAQRMAPQQLDEFVRAPNKTTSVAGKSLKQFQREQSLKHDIAPGLQGQYSLDNLKPIDWNAQKGGVNLILPGDKSGVDIIRGVAGKPLAQESVQEGGFPFALKFAQENPEEASQLWSSTGRAARGYFDLGKRVADQYGTTNVLPIYSSMPEGMEYALHFNDALVKGLKPNKADIRKLNDLMRQGQYKGQTFEDFKGFDDSDYVTQYMKDNPNFRKYFGGRMQVQDFAKNVGLPGTYGSDVLHAVTRPELRNVETGAGGNLIGRLDLNRPNLRKSSHGTYENLSRDPGYDIPGEAIGKTKYVTPYEMMFPDSLMAVRANPKQAPQEFGSLKFTGARQIIDNQHVDEMGMYDEAMKRLLGYNQGGEVQGYNAGSAVKGLKTGLGFLKPSAKSHSQDPKVARALEEYLKGNISQAERIAIMNKQLPLRPWTEMPPAYTDEQIKMALMENKRPKALADVPVGARVGNRLDIPAYTQHGVYVDTTHDLAKGNSPISYNRTGHLKDVEFSSKPNQAVRVGLGTKEQALTPMGAEMGSAKSPFALIKGTNQGTSDEEVRRMMAELMKDPSYAQIGMDPRRHSQFYDKSTGMPVWAAEEKLQSGPLILVPKRGLETTSWDDPRLNLSDFPGKQYAKGGSSTPAWQRKEGKNPEGGLNAAGRASYNRETGGNLKAPQPEGGPRKKSFCARMEGMKRKNTSSATANDPDSRINKSLRKWKC